MKQRHVIAQSVVGLILLLLLSNSAGAADLAVAKGQMLTSSAALKIFGPQIAGIAELSLVNGTYSYTFEPVCRSAKSRVGIACPVVPNGACDTDEECEDKTDEMCEDAGHGGVNEDSVTITMHADGGKTCSGDCQQNGAVAFVVCNPK